MCTNTEAGTYLDIVWCLMFSHSWHFDESSHSVTMMLQKPTRGGTFRYTAPIRTRSAGKSSLEIGQQGSHLQIHSPHQNQVTRGVIFRYTAPIRTRSAHHKHRASSDTQLPSELGQPGSHLQIQGPHQNQVSWGVIFRYTAPIRTRSAGELPSDTQPPSELGQQGSHFQIHSPHQNQVSRGVIFRYTAPIRTRSAGEPLLLGWSWSRFFVVGQSRSRLLLHLLGKQKRKALSLCQT